MWTLKFEFLKDNPAVVPHVTLENPGADENRDYRFPDYLITASPDRLAAFLALVHDNPAAWDELTSESRPLVREAASPGLPARAGTRLWSLIVTLFWIGVIGCGGLAAVRAYRRFVGGTSPRGALRRAWVEEVVRLLILAVRMTREDQTLRDQERSLIRNVAVAEAKRSDAPGDPIPLAPAEMDALIRGYEGECPGVPDLIGILAEPEQAAARTRLLKRIWQVAVCDGPATDREVAFAEGYAVDTGLSEAEFLSIARRYSRPGPPAAILEEARRLLDISPSATAEEVKRAYKRKAREYHPDAHAGVADNLKRLTAERFSQLGEAKDVLLAALGAVPLVGRDRAGRLVPAEDLPNEICCFCCGAVRPGVPAGGAFQARCPKCLALLFHEPDFAAELSREAREPTAAGSR